VLAATPRETFFLLGRFALAQTRRGPGGLGIAARLDRFARRQPPTAGAALLRRAISYGVSLDFDPDAWVLELAGAVLGDAPVQRARMLPHCESLVHAFFTRCLGGELPDGGRFEVAATAGNGASWGLVAHTMLVNRLLSPGDRVAVGTGRLPAGMELPDLGAYGLRTVPLPQDAVGGFASAGMDRLCDPVVKAVFVVSPVGLGRAPSIERLAGVLRGERPDLLVVADESLATLTDPHRAPAAALPGSVLSSYSFSAHFEAAGWQLGIVALHPANAYDLALAELPSRNRRRLARRYRNVAGDRGAAFIDRLAAEGGSLGVRGAGCLSAPQQVQAALFALSALVADERPTAVAAGARTAGDAAMSG